MRTAFAALALGALACSGGGSDHSFVATVGEVGIPLAELRRAVEARQDDAPDAARGDLANEELARLISEEAVLARALELSISVTDDEVNARLRALHGPDWKDDDSSYRAEVRRQMLMDRTAAVDLAERARVPESALLLYFEEHRAEYATPERVQIRQIVVAERSKADALRAQLEAGGDFAALAREASLAPEAADGGRLPPFARGDLPEAFDRAFGLDEPGQLSQVIESPYGFHIFRLEARYPAHTPLLGEVRARIERELQSRQMEELRREWMRGLRRTAQVKVDDDLLETLR